jgi:hypothetical protein
VARGAALEDLDAAAGGDQAPADGEPDDAAADDGDVRAKAGQGAGLVADSGLPSLA